MNHSTLHKTLLTILALAVLFTSCKKQFDGAAWDTDVLTPLAKADLSIDDLVAPSEKVVNPDSSVSIVFTKDLYEFGMDSLVTLDIEPFVRNVKIDSLKLSDQTITQDYTLGQVGRDIGPPFGDIILLNHGLVGPVPSIPGLSVGPVPVDMTAFLQTATLENGFMDLKINNGFPLDIQNVTYEVRNTSDASVVVNGSIPLIAAGDSVTDVKDLSGTTVEGNLEIWITNMDIVGGLVLIDTNDAITATITIRDLSVSAATAIFPAQEIVNNTDSVPLLGLGDIRIKEADIASGMAVIEVLNTVQDSLFFYYEIPDATLMGVPFSVYVTSPPAPPGDTSHVYLNFDFTGYHWNFQNNQFANTLTGRIDSTGEIRSISKSDSVFINLQIVGLTPSYLRAYMGQDTFNIGPDTTTLDIFNNVVSGTLDLQNTTMTVRVNNALGVAGDASINSLVATNTNTTNTQALNTGGIPNPINIPAATDGPLTPSNTTVVIDDISSNPSDLLEIFPNEISYDLTVRTNPLGFQGTCNDFAYQNQGLDVDLEIEVPLNLIATDLLLRDTVDLNTATVEKPDEIKDGTLSLLVDNGYPLEFNLNIYFMDAMGIVYDSLKSANKVAAAPVDGSNIVNGIEQTKLDFSVAEGRMSNLMSADRLIFEIDFTTVPNTPHLTLYSNYNIGLKLIGDFIYRFD